MSNIAGPGSGSLELIKRIEDLEASNEFSLEEKRIGTWIDGKPLYRKMIDFGTLPNNASKSVDLNMPEINHCHINLGESMFIGSAGSFSGASAARTLIHPYIKQASSSRATGITIETTGDASTSKALVCLEYTKTTD